MLFACNDMDLARIGCTFPLHFDRKGQLLPSAMSNNKKEYDKIFFRSSSRLGVAIPYHLLAVGTASITPRMGVTAKRFDEHVFILTTGGRGQIMVEGRKFEANEGDVVWLDTSMEYAHGCSVDADTWKYAWIGVKGYGLDTLIREVQGSMHPVFRVKRFRESVEAIHRLTSTLDKRDRITDSVCNAFVAELLDQVLEARQSPQRNVDESDRMVALFNQIGASLEKNWRVADMAESCNISQSQLFRSFRKMVDMTPMEWIRHERMNLAKQLLASSVLKIRTVATHCGYADPYHFSREFRRLTGLSPTSFRRKWTREAP